MEPSRFEFSLDPHVILLDADFHDDGRMGQAEQLSQDHAGLPETHIVGLQAGEDQVAALLSFQSGRQRLRRGVSIRSRKVVVFDQEAAISAFRQRLADRRGGSRRASRDGYHFSAVRFSDPQCLLERERVRIVHLVAEVGLADPAAAVVPLGASNSRLLLA